MAFALDRRRPANRRAARVMITALGLAVGGSVALGNTAHAVGTHPIRPTQVAAASLPCDSQFHVATSSGPRREFTSSVLGMAAVSANDVWAVGITTPTHYWYGTLAAHWDGSNWTQVASPYMASANNPNSALLAVTAVPGAVTNNVWAVGSSGSGPLAAQWNGSGWNLFTPPSTLVGSTLAGVAALSPTDIWAVGFGSPMIGAQTTRTLIEHYDGATWSMVPSPNLSPTSSDQLRSVSAASAVDVWAVGNSVDGTTHQTLTEHWNGISWSIVASPNVGTGDNMLTAVGALPNSTAWAVGSWTDGVGVWKPTTLRFDGASWTVVHGPTFDAGSTASLLSVAAISPDNIWAAGYIENTYLHPLVEHWDGQRWTVVPSPDGQPPISPQEFGAITASGGNIWAAGYEGDATPPPGNSPLFENLCIPAATVSSVIPVSGNATGGTTVSISGRDFNYVTGVSFGTRPAANFTVNSSTSITAATSSEAVGTVDVAVTNVAGTSAASPADLFIFVPPAVSWQQYRLDHSDGVTWQSIDTRTLALTFTPTANSYAILTGNADLWTAQAGVNQDLGIFITTGANYLSAPGELLGWKESGGNAGTFSPNAAFVQTITPVVAGNSYTVTLGWKANHATSGTIFAAAGDGLSFSPTRLTAELVPINSINLQGALSYAQYGLTGSGGKTWQSLDDSALSIHFTPISSRPALLSANADLWTQNAGVNQDLGIFVSGGAFGSGQILAWKESGGYAGTFSPDAVYVQTVAQLEANTAYVITLQWKANHATSGTIRVGAGLWPRFSPTRLTLNQFPTGTCVPCIVTFPADTLRDAASNQQYRKVSSTGSDWMPIDASKLQLQVATTVAANYILSGNADLWTANPGVNQDLGIMISGGVFGTAGTLVAWKESGGFAGTFSPNAASVQTVIPLAASTTYTVTLVWKANHLTNGTIYAGAGLGPLFSSTSLTAQT